MEPRSSRSRIRPTICDGVSARIEHDDGSGRSRRTNRAERLGGALRSRADRGHGFGRPGAHDVGARLVVIDLASGLDRQIPGERHPARLVHRFGGRAPGWRSSKRSAATARRRGRAAAGGPGRRRRCGVETSAQHRGRTPRGGTRNDSWRSAFGTWTHGGAATSTPPERPRSAGRRKTRAASSSSPPPSTMTSRWCCSRRRGPQELVIVAEDGDP